MANSMPPRPPRPIMLGDWLDLREGDWWSAAHGVTSWRQWLGPPPKGTTPGTLVLIARADP